MIKLELDNKLLIRSIKLLKKERNGKKVIIKLQYSNESQLEIMI